MASKLLLMLLLVISFSCFGKSHWLKIDKGKAYLEKKHWPYFPRYGGRVGGGFGFTGDVGQRGGGGSGGNDGFGYNSGDGDTFGGSVGQGGNVKNGKFSNVDNEGGKGGGHGGDHESSGARGGGGK